MRLNRILFISLLSLGTLMLSNGCGSNEGCTDPNADNFDPDAESSDNSCVYSGCTDPAAENFNSQASNDDGSCVFARDKFFGSFLGSFACMDPVLVSITNSDSVVFEIKEPVDPEDKSRIVLGLTLGGIPVDLDGTVSGNTFTLNDTLRGIPIPIPIIGSVNADIIGNGTAELSDDEQNISGVLDLVIALDLDVPGVPAEIMDMCNLVGVRQ